jgi:cytochrome c peroxidase
MRVTKWKVLRKSVAVVLAAVMVFFGVTPAMAQSPGSVLTTPVGPMELPIEVEIELSPAGSLKQAAVWKELYQLLKNPYEIDCPPDDPATSENESYFCTATIPRRPGFGAAMPPLRIYSPGYNFLTAQPLRRRTSDGEVSWDQPGPMFDPEEAVVPDAFNTPTLLRTPIGHLVACPNPAIGGYQAASVPADFCDGKPGGSLVVYNNTASDLIPPNGTVVATAAYVGGQLLDDEGAPITELEAPVNEEDFFRDPADTTSVPVTLRPYIGRPGAEVLGKALFWDMQVGSDGVQACGSCHFHAGVDNRTRGQLNPNVNGPLANNALLEVQPPNTDVVATDFPFHQGGQDDLTTDSDDVMSSMGVSRFKLFNDIPLIGIANFLPAVNGVRAVAPDVGTVVADPVPANEGFRRVEPRNTPTMHAAAFNFDNFWDARARFSYNGGSVFGPSDPTPHIFINPGLATGGGGAFAGATMGDIRPDLVDEDPEIAEQPVRIKFSSLASQSQGPPLSDFEMSFSGRNWAKIGKKLLQGDEGNIENQGTGAPQQAGTNRANAVVPLANQLVATDDSRIGPFSNQGGSVCAALGRPAAVGKPGLCISYFDLIRLAFGRQFWNRQNRHLDGAAAVCTASAVNGVLTPAGCDPFDGYVLTPANGAANANNTNQFTQMEANFSLFFGLSVQAYETLLIPDHTPADQFFDANPHAGGGVGEPGDQAVLFPTLVPDLIDDGELNGSPGATVNLVPDNPATPWYDAFGPDELFGFDLFAGANLTAALAPGQSVDPRSGRDRNPPITNTVGQTIRVGSNPFTRSAKCMLCHLGPEQTDHSINISHGLLKNDAEFEYPVPPTVPDPTTPATFIGGLLPAPEPSGSSRTVVGLILEEEVGEGVAQDAVEVEPRDFQVFDDPATPWDDRIVAQEGNFAFGDQGVYNIGVRPFTDDFGRGGNDPFGWPLSLAALTLKNIGGPEFEPCDTAADSCVMTNFDPSDIGAEGGAPQGFEETGDGALYPGTTHTLQSINPGFERDPMFPQLPEHMAPWIHSLPAGELHPQIDEMAGMVPNTVTAPNGGPGIEFPEIMFGADFHCAAYDPATFGFGPPNFGWGPPSSTERLCPQHQSGVAGNFAFPSQGTWPVPNRVMRDGAFKAPPLRNVEMTGPFFHTGSFLTLRQVVDFYFEGGDFPVTNAHSRDPHVVNLEMQAFAFGPTQGGNLLTPFDCSADPPNDPVLYPLVPGGCGDFGYLIGSFGDGLPDTAFLYDEYPDSDHPLTPEPSFASRAAALEDAKSSLVKFLLALTDPRVKLEQAPFDKPEMFVPIDGAAPENLAGRGTVAVPGQADLVSLSGVPCTEASTGTCFRQIAAVGAGGIATPLPGFLGVTSVPPGAPGFSCSAAAGVSHFCSTVTP